MYHNQSTAPAICDVYQCPAALARPQSFVAKCEAGQRRVDVVELQAFARVYKVPLEFFVR
jgi:hypothetical protein